MSPAPWIILLLVVGAVAVIVGAVSYNRLIKQRDLVDASWRRIDAELRRRHELVPTLVDSVTAYAAHERSTFEAVALARAAASSPDSSRVVQAERENVLTSVLRQLLGIAESYPQLRASELFVAQQEQLARVEDRIAAGRRVYNGHARALNTRVDSFPSSLVARMAGVAHVEYFEADDPTVRSASHPDA